MTDTDKLFLFVFEAARPDQVDTPLEISRTKGRRLSMMVVEAMQGLMDSLPQVRAAKEADAHLDIEELAPA
jgi:hypothetical protein